MPTRAKKADRPEHPGESMKARRLSAGMTQREFAERLGMSPQYIVDVEKGRRGISVALAVALERIPGWVMNAEWWLDLDMRYELAKYRAKHANDAPPPHIPQPIIDEDEYMAGLREGTGLWWSDTGKLVTTRKKNILLAEDDKRTFVAVNSAMNLPIEAKEEIQEGLRVGRLIYDTMMRIAPNPDWTEPPEVDVDSESPSGEFFELFEPFEPLDELPEDRH